MQRALDLAAATVALASPNPQVGCVLVKNNEIIGEGAHLYENRDHAEIVALKQAAERGIDVTGATAYVTLEPCSHHGRTGPCADALVAARVTRVVVATIDPNPQVSGEGVARLRAAGIDVTIGTLQQQARDLNEAFAHFIQHRTPFVTLKAALSADGYLAPSPVSRTANQPHWLTGPAARTEVQRLRHASDAILTGIGTVLADNPALTDRSGLPRRRPLLRVILDTHLRIHLDSQLLRIHLDSQLLRTADHDLLLLTTPTTPSEEPEKQKKIEALRERGAEIQTIPEQDGQLDLFAILRALAERNILSLFLECGSHLNGAFLAQNLVDKVVLFYSEAELGPESIPFAKGISSPRLFQQSLQRTTQTSFVTDTNTDTCLTGYLHDPWPVV
jgi:diaminohydroxyphosphoribosylaminopyrimidine deaminase/5-amino-6-(5-phosphoribosylamino)uracil reductase